jgi:hypothetical protein
MVRPKSGKEPQLLGEFISLASFLGIFLYFTGWIYRWAYFGYFYIDVITINLSQQSFLLVPLQVFFGSWHSALKALATMMVTVAMLGILLKGLQNVATGLDNDSIVPFPGKILGGGGMPGLIDLRPVLRLITRPLSVDVLVVVVVLNALFWLARSQGIDDARRDAYSDTSLLPIATVIFPKEDVVLGRRLEQPLFNSSLNGFAVVGDLGRFQQLRGRELNDTTIPTQPVWRLLLDGDGWLYLIPSIPPGMAGDRSLRPTVLALIKGDNSRHTVILSSEPYAPGQGNGGKP